MGQLKPAYTMSTTEPTTAEVLRTSLGRLNLPILGSREQMWKRLKIGGEKMKPDPKPPHKKKQGHHQPHVHEGDHVQAGRAQILQ